MWEKGNLRRIYMNDEGYNTKKMSTKVFLWEDENGSIQVSCRIDCPSQGWEWIASQKKAIIEEVEHRIAPLLAEIDGVELPAAEVDTEALAAAASQAVEFVTPTDDGDGRYWLNVYHGAARYTLIFKDGRIAAAVMGGIAGCRPPQFPVGEWRTAISDVIRGRLGDGWTAAEADGSGTRFFLNGRVDGVKCREYYVPAAGGGKHLNIEILPD